MPTFQGTLRARSLTTSYWTGSISVEFVDHDETIEALKEQGLREVPDGENRIGLALDDSDSVVHLASPPDLALLTLRLCKIREYC